MLPSRLDDFARLMLPLRLFASGAEERAPTCVVFGLAAAGPRLQNLHKDYLSCTRRKGDGEILRFTNGHGAQPRRQRNGRPMTRVRPSTCAGRLPASGRNSPRPSRVLRRHPKDPGAAPVIRGGASRWVAHARRDYETIWLCAATRSASIALTLAMDGRLLHRWRYALISGCSGTSFQVVVHISAVPHRTSAAEKRSPSM